MPYKSWKRRNKQSFPCPDVKAETCTVPALNYHKRFRAELLFNVCPCQSRQNSLWQDVTEFPVMTGNGLCHAFNHSAAYGYAMDVKMLFFTRIDGCAR